MNKTQLILEGDSLSVDIVLRNAKIFINGRIVEAGLAIDEGKISKIAKETNLPVASTRVNLKGKIILPGLIDLHVHLRDQQLAYKEDFFSGAAAAAAGGVTMMIDMPNNKPVTMSSPHLRERVRLAEKRVVVNVAFYSAFPQELREVPSILKEGAVGFKLYMSEKIGGVDVDDDQLILRTFHEVAKAGVPVAVHAEDRKILETLKRQMERAGRKDVEAYARAHPPEAEARAIRRVVHLAKKSGVQVHLCHMSSAIGLDAFLTAKNAGLPVTCEATPHHLLLTSEHLKRARTLALTSPPLRPRTDVKSLWKALQQGYVDAIASDHAPHALEEKEVDSVWNSKPGIPGLETTLPLLLTQVNEGLLTLARLVRLTAETPAKILRLWDRGGLKEGNWADIVVVDLKRRHKIYSSTFHSKARYSPFDEWKVKGKPVKTFVNGELVMDEGDIVAKAGIGRIVRRTPERRS